MKGDWRKWNYATPPYASGNSKKFKDRKLILVYEESEKERLQKLLKKLNHIY